MHLKSTNSTDCKSTTPSIDVSGASIIEACWPALRRSSVTCAAMPCLSPRTSQWQFPLLSLPASGRGFASQAGSYSQPSLSEEWATDGANTSAATGLSNMPLALTSNAPCPSRTSISPVSTPPSSALRFASTNTSLGSAPYTQISSMPVMSRSCVSPPAMAAAPTT